MSMKYTEKGSCAMYCVKNIKNDLFWSAERTADWHFLKMYIRSPEGFLIIPT